MTSTFESDFDTYAIPALERLFGVSVTLSRGSSSTSSFTAMRKDLVFTVIDEDGFSTQHSRRIYELPKSSVKFTTQEIKPREGDRIAETVNGKSYLYEVSPVGDQPAVFEDPGGFRWMVRTKRVE